MGKWLRRIRGALGMGVAWGLAWFGAGMVLLLIVGPDAADVPFPLGFGLLGFLAGALFSGILGLVERGRGFHQLSFGRFVGWGAAGGLLFSVLFAFTVTVTGAGALLDDLVFLAPLFAGAGAASAGGALALARRADDRVLPDGGSDVGGPEVGGRGPEERLGPPVDPDELLRRGSAEGRCGVEPLHEAVLVGRGADEDDLAARGRRQLCIRRRVGSHAVLALDGHHVAAGCLPDRRLPDRHSPEALGHR
ncbi:MAG: hypothetical protein GWM90_14155, partial [Gemmatimonadetes bacterium]|nr:hypothetical protein [Gemmatimonadota bacterium]NIQ55281.1 hypothetical protein [Gemmatimonadota bacterium]NIU75482.1 hypothetical protein [Gammaproteobacteria bacterium]NIX45211.1 hypothetical protein [Gemmatimonadota bacterium]NIY09465.1 hypothetical protein [Gemmatimonadota bacterium]